MNQSQLFLSILQFYHAWLQQQHFNDVHIFINIGLRKVPKVLFPYFV